ncbi:ParA family protein [Vibrio mediterranei]|uniref:CobQ/CobB/MinD/ParA nucleotide binding domain-containing protein n=1 Tax=Vibrio mediterranei TaxID=689 RepID=A0ABX5D888_9VIBR|nr:ParA family protein [Vibrio mediterranei]MCG9660893.1 ParA family protein [Vibrio mediterranei]PRQ65162.1 hypothetical protein COR51_23870 [Vibrio mediterranei]
MSSQTQYTPFRKSVIAVASAKGGVGKSTHTFNLAVFYHQNLKLNVLVLDVEKQPSLSEIAYQGSKVEGKRLDIKHYFDAEQLLDDVEMFKMRYDLILIDTAGADVDIQSGLDAEAQEAMNESALATADYVVVPAKPSALDARKTLKFSKSLTKWMKARRGGLGAICFLNEAKMRENLTREVHSQMKNGLLIEYSDNFIMHSPYVAEAIMYGLGTTEFKPKHPISEQIAALATEIMDNVQNHLAQLEG